MTQSAETGSPPALRTARRAGLIEQVIEQLRAQIVTGGWAIGSRIPTESELAHLTGVRPVSAAAGSSEWVMPASEWLCSPVPGRLYGGATALIAGLAFEGSIQTTVPAGTAFATVDLTTSPATISRYCTEPIGVRLRYGCAPEAQAVFVTGMLR